jgi:hypothetical protein
MAICFKPAQVNYAIPDSSNASGRTVFHSGYAKREVLQRELTLPIVRALNPALHYPSPCEFAASPVSHILITIVTKSR